MKAKMKYKHQFFWGNYIVIFIMRIDLIVTIILFIYIYIYTGISSTKF